MQHQNDIVSGKSAYVKGKLVNGSMPVLQSGGYNSAGEGHANATSTQYGAHSAGDTTRYIYLGIPRNTSTGNNTYIRTSESEVARVLGVTGAKIAQGQSIAGVSGTYTSDATANANQMLSGVTAYVRGNKITGTIGSKGAATYTPGTVNQTIGAGQYLSGAQTIKGDGNLTAGNIKSGVSIFGVSGTFTADATATSGDIASGKTAYVKGAKVTGTGGNYKVYKIQTQLQDPNCGSTVAGYQKVTSITSTGTVPTWKNGSWVSMGTKGNKISFTIDLGFTPTEVKSCDIRLFGNAPHPDDGILVTNPEVENQDDGILWTCQRIYSGGNLKNFWAYTREESAFRYNRGYDSGTTTAAHYYDTFLQATLNKYTSWGKNSSATNKSGYSTQCVINGSKLSFVVGNEYTGTAAGYPMYTAANEFYIKGSITYK